MALSVPRGFDANALHRLVENTYQRLADDPKGSYHFHHGADYAVDVLGYDPEAVSRVPQPSRDRFAGVGNPHRVGPIASGEVVLDHACGAGLDVLLAVERVGARGRVIGVDMTPGMREVAESSARAAGLDDRVEIRAGLFEELPVESNSVDVVISNGVLNLAPDKRRVMRELTRVLRPGGRLHLSDVVVRREIKPEVRNDPELWAACIGGALPEREVLPLLASVGFVAPRLIERFDCFAGSSAGERVADDLAIRGASFVAQWPTKAREEQS